MTNDGSLPATLTDAALCLASRLQAVFQTGMVGYTESLTGERPLLVLASLFPFTLERSRRESLCPAPCSLGAETGSPRHTAAPAAASCLLHQLDVPSCTVHGLFLLHRRNPSRPTP